MCPHIMEKESSGVSSSSGDNSSIGLGPYPMTTFNLYNLLKGPVSKYNPLEIRGSPCEFGEDTHFHFITVYK